MAKRGFFLPSSLRAVVDVARSAFAEGAVCTTRKRRTRRLADVDNQFPAFAIATNTHARTPQTQQQQHLMHNDISLSPLQDAFVVVQDGKVAAFGVRDAIAIAMLSAAITGCQVCVCLLATLTLRTCVK